MPNTFTVLIPTMDSTTVFACFPTAILNCLPHRWKCGWPMQTYSVPRMTIRTSASRLIHGCTIASERIPQTEDCVAAQIDKTNQGLRGLCDIVCRVAKEVR